MIPRGLVFDSNGICLGTSMFNSGASIKTVSLPTDHYDFLGPINPVGKTLKQIEAEVQIELEKSFG
jgi:hypothetical protein